MEYILYSLLPNVDPGIDNIQELKRIKQFHPILETEEQRGCINNTPGKVGLHTF